MKCSTDPSGCASRCIKTVILVAAGIAAVTWLVMLLWNGLLPDLFAGVSRIGYWQALGLLLLCRILFGGLRGHGSRLWRERRTHENGMTPEEFQQLKGRFHKRWHACCSSGPGATPPHGDAGDPPAAGA